MKANKTIIGGGALFGLVFLSVSLLSSPFVHADSSGTVDITAILPTNCSMVTTNNNLAVNASVGMNNEIGTAKIKALCNDANGFAIYAVGYTDEQYGNNVLTTELTTDEHNYDIETGLGTSGDSNWNMTITNDGDVENDYVASIESAFATAHEIPSVYTKVASFSASTDQSIGSNILATFNTYIAPGQPASTYHGKVKFTLVHPGVNVPDVIDEPYSMQRVAMWAEVVAEGRTVRVYDERDNVEYTAARLADGKIWMTKNLRLDLKNANITAENTNNPTQQFLLEAKSAMGDNASWCTSTAAECLNRVNYSTINLGNNTTDSYDHTYDDYGVYYNWYAATAGNGTYETPNYTSVSGDICPSGWHLPLTDNGYSNGDFYNLASSIRGIFDGSDAFDANVASGFLHEPANFVLSGNARKSWNSDELDVYRRGEGAAYWTGSKRDAAYRVWYWMIGETGTHGYNYGDGQANYGNAVRCLADLQSYTVDVVYGTGIQSVSIDGNVVPNGGTVTLVEGTSHEITTILSSEYEFTEWSATDGVIENREAATTNFKMSHRPMTITANAKTIVGFDDAFSMAGKSKLNGYYKMQDMTPALCESISKNQVGQLIDSRDNIVYSVGKLADNNCWMTKNLRLDFEHANITAENTNNPTEAFLNAYSTVKPSNNGGTWKSCEHVTGAGAINYDTQNIGVTTQDSLGHTYDEYGVYYNYYAATAGNSIHAETSGVPAGDICSFGWHLPTGDYTDNSEFHLLRTATQSVYGSDNLLTTPANFVVSGNHSNGLQGQVGYYWTGSTYNAYSAHTIQISSTGSYTRTYYDKNWGYTIRCAADKN